MEKQDRQHKKEMAQLSEKLYKLETDNQNNLKEKNALMSSSKAKDREIVDLDTKFTYLRNTFEKADKSSAAFHQSFIKANLLFRKSEGMAATLKTVTEERDALRAKVESMEHDLQGNGAKSKEELKEMVKRLHLDQEKMEAQKKEFSAAITAKEEQCEQLKTRLDTQTVSFDRQKQAYHDRIQTLESDLEVTERALIKKDELLDDYTGQIERAKQAGHMEVESTLSKMRAIVEEAEHRERETASKLSEAMRRLETCQNQLEELEVGSEKERGSFEKLIFDLESTVEQFKHDQTMAAEAHQREIDTKNKSIEIAERQLKTVKEELELVESTLVMKDGEILGGKEALENAKKEAGELRSVLEEQSDRVDSTMRLMEEKQLASTARISELEKELERMAELVSSKDGEGQGYMQRAHSAEKLVSEVQSELHELKRNLSEKSQNLIDLNESKNLLDQELASLTATYEESTRRWRDDYENAQEKIHALTLESRKLSAEVERLEQDAFEKAEIYDATLLEQSQIAESKYEDLLVEFERAESALVDAKTELNDLAQKNANLEAQMEQECDTLRSSVSDLQDDLRRVRVQNESLSVKYRESQEKGSDLESYHGKEIARLESKLVNASRELVERDSTIQTLHAKISKLGEELNCAYESQKMESVAHSKALADQRVSLEKSQVCVSELKDTVFKMTDEAKRQAIDLQTVTTQLEESRARLRSILQEHHDLEKTCADQLLEIKHLNEEVKFNEELLSEVRGSYAEALEHLHTQNELSEFYHAQMMDAQDNQLASHDQLKQAHDNTLVMMHQFEELSHDYFKVLGELCEKERALLKSKSDLHDLEDCVKSQSEELERLSKKNGQLEMTVRRRAEAIADEKASHARIWDILIDTESDVDTLQEDVAEKSDEIVTLQTELNVALSELSEQKHVVLCTKEELVAVSEEVANLKSAVAAYERDVDGLNQALESETTICSARGDRVRELESDIEAFHCVEKELRKALASAQESMTTSTKEYTDMISKLKKDLEDKTSLYQSAKDTTEKQEVRLTHLKDAVSSLETALSQEREKSQELSSSLGDLKTSSSALSAALYTCKEKLETAEAALAQSLIELKDISSEKDRTAAELSKLKADYQSLQNEDVSKSTKMVQLESELARITAEREKLTCTIDNLKHAMNASTESAERNAKEMDGQLRIKSEMIDSLSLDVSNLKELLSETQATLTSTRETLETRVEGLGKDLYRMQNLKESLDRELTQLRQTSSSEITSLSEKKSELERQLSAYQQEISQLRVLCESASSENVVLREEISMVQKQHEHRIEQLQAANAISLEEVEKLKLSYESEITALRSKTSDEIDHLRVKNNELVSASKSKDQEYEALYSKKARLVTELDELRAVSKKEFAVLQGEIVALKSKLESESEGFEASVQELSARLAEKSNALRQSESVAAEMLNEKNLLELRATNEISARDLLIKTNDLKLKEKTKALEAAQEKLDLANQNLESFQKRMKSTIADRVQTEVKTAIAELEQDKATLRHATASLENENQDLLSQLDNYKIEIEDLQRQQKDEKENFDSKLHLLEMRGQLQSSEIKKIGDLNADLFGHSNARQKIKHVAQIKEENVKLKQEKLALTRERDVAKGKLMNLERELDMLKSTRRTSKAGRSFLAESRRNGEDSRSKSTMFAIDEESKENLSIQNVASRGMGGISFTIE